MTASSVPMWAVLAALLIAITLVIAGLRRRAEQRYVWAVSLIRPPRPLHETHDETLPKQARERRERADRYRRAAVRLESGQPASTPSTDRVVAMVGRR